MARLEEEVRPRLEPLMFDDPVDLDAEAQRCLAIWLTKTALIHDLIEGGPQMASDAERRWFGEHQQPFPGSRMWIARYVGDIGSICHVWRSIVLGAVDDPGIVAIKEYGQIFTLVLGKVALQVVLPKQPSTIRFRRPVPDGIPEFWPVAGSIRWPLPLSLDTNGLNVFSRPGPSLPQPESS